MKLVDLIIEIVTLDQRLAFAGCERVCQLFQACRLCFNMGMSRFLLNIEKRSLPRWMFKRRWLGKQGSRVSACFDELPERPATLGL
jgi:hypothetical protein